MTRIPVRQSLNTTYTTSYWWSSVAVSRKIKEAMFQPLARHETSQ